jgi:GNAT superfamily N-acetyltransferase
MAVRARGEDGLEVRPALLADAEALAALAGELGYPATPELVEARLAAILAGPGHAVLVAESIPGEVVGWIHVFGARRVESEPFAELGGLVVREGHRGRGIGRRLVEAARRWAAVRGFSTLRVRTSVVREEAHRFYRGLGFELAKRQSVFSRALE